MLAKYSTPPAFEKSWTTNVENFFSTTSSISDKISGFVVFISAIFIETCFCTLLGNAARIWADNAGFK